jgi:peptidoglycan/LPS O-acetylase OafA/YrhL
MNGDDMNRFLHECVTDPALSVVLVIAFILVAVMSWFVLQDKLKQRRVNRRLQRRRGEIKAKQAEALRESLGSK